MKMLTHLVKADQHEILHLVRRKTMEVGSAITTVQASRVLRFHGFDKVKYHAQSVGEFLGAVGGLSIVGAAYHGGQALVLVNSLCKEPASKFSHSPENDKRNSNYLGRTGSE